MEEKILSEILSRFSLSLLNIKGTTLRRINDVIFCCTRIFKMTPKSNCQIFKILIKVIVDQLNEMRSIVEKTKVSKQIVDEIGK